VNTPGAERLEQRVLILAPVGKDAALMHAMLARDGVDCLACPDLGALARELELGAAALLIEEEALAEADGRITSLIAHQPPWSDLPVLLLTRTGSDSVTAIQGLQTLGNVTLLERPVRVAALASAVRSALRARRRQYQTRAHLLEREQADQRKDEFLATLAHELRNPLAPIRNSVNLLRLSGSDGPAAKVWQMMDRQVSHMVRLVDDLMEVSRITRGKIALQKTPLDLAGVIAAAVETCRPLMEAARHTLEVLPPQQPLTVEGDAVRLCQVFANLLNNAAKYTDSGGRVSVVARTEGDNAVVTVSDSGVGIAAEALPRVFEMFVQADASDSRAQTGLGIGLTLVKSLVEMHGGSVAAYSAGAGQGSSFEVRLPLAQRDAVDGRPSETGMSALKGAPRLLVVDDNRDAADSLGALLEMLGAEVRVAHSGPAALEAVASFHPDAVLLDIGMPGMNGYEVANRIRTQGNGSRNTTLIALTGWGQDNDRRRSAEAGFDHHLVKPADVGALQTLLAALAANGSQGRAK
jgi:signal transduction histidine kinase/ActR/RegA family two-component response regulator